MGHCARCPLSVSVELGPVTLFQETLSEFFFFSLGVAGAGPALAAWPGATVGIRPAHGPAGGSRPLTEPPAGLHTVRGPGPA